jgi:hypothetical protein
MIRQAWEPRALISTVSLLGSIREEIWYQGEARMQDINVYVVLLHECVDIVALPRKQVSSNMAIKYTRTMLRMKLIPVVESCFEDQTVVRVLKTGDGIPVCKMRNHAVDQCCIGGVKTKHDGFVLSRVNRSYDLDS